MASASCPGAHPQVTPARARTLAPTSARLHQAARAVRGWVQKPQRRASIGISLRHSGHFLVVGSAGAGALRMRAINALIGVTTKKYTAPATSRNDTNALMKSPTGNGVPLMVKLMEEKSGLPTMAAMSGVRRSLVKAVTTDPKAAPMTTPTARSTTLPRRMNCLKPLSMEWNLQNARRLIYGGDKG